MKYGVFRCQFPLNQSIEWFTIIFAYGNGNEIKIKVVGVAGSGRQGIEIWGLTLAMNRWNFSAIHQNCYGWVKQGLKWIQNFMTLTIWNGAFIYIYTQLYIYIVIYIYNYVYIYIIIYIYICRGWFYSRQEFGVPPDFDPYGCRRCRRCASTSP